MIMRAEAQFWGVDDDRILEMENWLKDVVGELELHSQEGLATKNSQPEDNEPEADFIFAPTGNCIYIAAFGELGHFKNTLKGFGYLLQVIQQPRRPFLATELHNSKVNDTTCQPLADDQTVRELYERREVARQDLEKAREDSDTVAEQVELEEIEQVEKLLRDVLSPSGNAKTFPTTQISANNSVRACIERAIDMLRKADPPLLKTADHFVDSMDYLPFVIYEPSDKTITWSTCRP